MRALLLMAIFVAFLGLSPPVAAVEAGTGAIEGLVINGTADGSSTADLEVTLNIYLDGTEVGSAVAETDAEGGFRFDGLETEPGYSYQCSLEHQDVGYTSEWISFGEGETAKSVDITVYDSTTSDEAIKVAVAHAIVYAEEGDLRIVEYFLLVNEGDRAYVGSREVTSDGEKETLRFSLPDGATGLEYTEGLMVCCVVQTEDGFVDTMPVHPGGKEVAFSYRVDHNSGTFTLSKAVHYHTLTFALMVQGEDIQVVSDQLTMAEPLTTEGAQYAHFTGGDLAPGTELVAHISGLPQAGSQGFPKWAYVLLLVTAHGAGLTFLVRRRRRQRARPEALGLQVDPERMKQMLLREIADLDDDFEAGNISPEVYETRRHQRKMELIELMRQTEGKTYGGREGRGHKPGSPGDRG